MNDEEKRRFDALAKLVVAQDKLLGAVAILASSGFVTSHGIQHEFEINEPPKDVFNKRFDEISEYAQLRKDLLPLITGVEND